MIKKSRKEYQKEWNLKNKEHIKEYKKEYNLKNKEHIKEQKKEYRLKNREDLLKKRREYEKKRRCNDPNFRMQINMRTAMSHAIAGKKKKSTNYEYNWL